MIKRAILSVSDKTNIVEFAQKLSKFKVEILATGGTAKLLTQSNIAVIEIADYTGYPELLDGRLKTLHPRIHGGILARRHQDETILNIHNIPLIDLVVVNLYPFIDKVATPDCTIQDAIEYIDIGGPTLLRAAAKNYAAVTVIVDPKDYMRVIIEMNEHAGATIPNTRFDLAIKAFTHTANYDAAISQYLKNHSVQSADLFPPILNLQFTHIQTLRYGENPHQQAAFYREFNANSSSIATAMQIQGKELSFNNIADADAALECIKQFPEVPTCVIVKHANPCGVAISMDLTSAYERAYRTDPESAFGGIIAVNQELDAVCARTIIQRQFVEVIIAPSVSQAAQSILATKPNIRLLICGELVAMSQPRLDYKRINNGMLVQEADLLVYNELKVVTRRSPTNKEMQDLLFTWRVAKFVKSNAIVYGKDSATIGIGAGQMSRVNSARIAVLKAQQADLSIQGAVLASDAFFPFRDGLDQAAAAGITAIIQPGGSMRDSEVIAAADEYDMAMIFTGMRHFRH